MFIKTSMNYIDDTRWQDLSDSIVLMAVDDWRRANLDLRNPMTASIYAREMKESCEKFFLSPWFETLTGFNGSHFLKKLKQGFSFK